MSKYLRVVVAGMLAAAGAASAHPILQFDLNGFSAQAVNGSNVNSPFGGLSHTGAVSFSVGSGQLNAILVQSVPFGSFVNQGFAGSTLTGFTGQITLSNGAVTGGSITVAISNGDSYTCAIASGLGQVSNFVGGGFKIEALTRNGLFNDSTFGNVDVSPWFTTQGAGGLLGSLLEFNYTPDAAGFASSDMDLWVDVVPLPPAAWAGLATMGGIMLIGAIRRRRTR